MTQKAKLARRGLAGSSCHNYEVAGGSTAEDARSSPSTSAIDIWIDKATDLGKGLGTQMMQLVLARCFADPAVTAVLVNR